MRIVTSLLIAAVLTAAPTAVLANVIGIETATFDPAPTDSDTNDGNVDRTLTSFDYDGTTWAVLTGTSSATVMPQGGHNEYIYAENGTDPGNGDENMDPGEPEAAVASGLVVTTGVLNSNADMMFGADATGGGPLFIWEVTGNDDITVEPLDVSGAPIGSWSLSVSGSDWGTEFLETDFDAPNYGVSNQPIAGVAFQLSDFTGDTGTLSGVYGIRATDSDGSFDPMIAGFAVPEPATLALLGLGGLGLVMRRRR